MSKNAAAGRRLAATAGALALVAAGCRSRPQPDSAFQGIVEYEERLLSFEVGGRVDSVDVRRGDTVADGKVLARIDDSLAKLARATRADNVEGARADLALLESGARREDVAALAAQARAAVASEGLLRKVAERARALFESGSLPEAELDRSNAELERATAERKSIEQRLASLQRGARTEEIARARSRFDAATNELALEDQRLARHSLKALGPGEVLDTHLEPGEMAAPGVPVVTLADTMRPYIEVFVPQGDLAGIQAGVKTLVRVDSSETSLSGVVEHLASRTEFTPRYLFSERERPNLVVRVRVRVDDPERKTHAGVPAFVTFAR